MKKIRFIIGIGISIFFLYLVFRKVDFEDTIKIISSTNMVYILLMLILMIPTLMIRSMRWKIMFSNYKKIPITNFLEAIIIGIMTNNLLPFRSGDLAQVFFLGYKTNLSKSTIFSTIILERLCDLFTMGVILICGSFFVLLPEEISKEKIFIFLVIVFLCIFLVFRLRKKLIILLDKVLPESKLKTRIMKMIENFYLGLESIKKQGVLIKVIFFTLVLWFFCSMGLYLCLFSVGIKVGFLVAVFFLSMTGLGAMIPFSPGNIGPLEFFITMGLVIFGIEKNYAVSFALVYRLMSWLPSTLLGLIILTKNNFSIKQIVQSGKEYSF